MHNALQIAHYIINYCTKKGTPVSNLELQKILYYLQVCYVKYYNQELFGEDICAWQYGPVVPTVYRIYSGYGGAPICNLYLDADSIILDLRKKFDCIIEKLISYGPWELVDMTHKAGGPWDKIYRNGLGNRDVIPTDLLKTDNTLEEVCGLGNIL